MTRILAAVLVFACVLAGLVLWPRVVPVSDGPGPAPRPAPSSGPAPAIPEGPAVSPTRPAPARPKLFRMPDGTEVPMLNGVVELNPNPWPSDVPYSRILGKDTDAAGIEWYVHADGTKSTMQNILRSDLGRVDGTFIVASGKPVIPPAAGGGAAPTGSRPDGH